MRDSRSPALRHARPLTADPVQPDRDPAPSARIEPAARAVIIQRIIPHYRVEFFNALTDRLAENGTGLTVLAGEPQPQESFRDGRGEVRAHAPRRTIPIGPFYYQRVLADARRADVVVMEHANAPIANHILAGLRALGRRRPLIAYWGHGDDLQHGDDRALRRRIKRGMVHLADHYFAYTEGSRQRLLAGGYPDARITVTNNSMAVSLVEPARGDDRARRRIALGLTPFAPVALFCARLTGHKRLPFLIEACDLARAARADLEVVIIGDGPALPQVRSAAAVRPWLHAVGARHGADKADYFAVSDLFLLPSMVGLSILDAFAAGLPMVTASFGNHSPEVEYLRGGENGVMTEATADDYAAAIVALAGDEARRASMGNHARMTARAFSLDNMVGCFARGLAICLRDGGLRDGDTRGRRPFDGPGAATAGR